MKLLVTGAAGFIGSAYARMVLAPGGADPAREVSRLAVLDKLTYAGTLDNLPLDDSKLEFVRGDICDGDVVDTLMAGADQVVHFAAESHVDNSIAAAGEFVRTNVLGTQILLDAALRHGVDRFVHVSTDEVYGSVDTARSLETDPLSPTSPYAASKAASDLIALAYHRTHRLDVRVTRCCNNYGPRQFPEKFIPRGITRLLDGRQIPLYGDGLHRRDWLHVDDHCRAVELVRTAGEPGGIYNISGRTELTNREIVGLLLDAVGAGWDRVAHVADRKAHDRRYAVSDDRARERLGYRPRHDLAKGIAETVAWYRDNRSWWEPVRR